MVHLPPLFNALFFPIKVRETLKTFFVCATSLMKNYMLTIYFCLHKGVCFIISIDGKGMS